jgi:hypothetical protein
MRRKDHHGDIDSPCFQLQAAGDNAGKPSLARSGLDLVFRSSGDIVRQSTELFKYHLAY